MSKNPLQYYTLKCHFGISNQRDADRRLRYPFTKQCDALSLSMDNVVGFTSKEPSPFFFYNLLQFF